MPIYKTGFLVSIFSVKGWQRKHEPHLMHTKLFLTLQRKQAGIRALCLTDMRETWLRCIARLSPQFGIHVLSI